MISFLEHGLDFAELLTAGSYKEEHRSAMLSWSEKIRQ
jgi:Phosphomevalonate kinase